MSNLTELPKNLPRPIDDGLANHLMGTVFPGITLQSTGGNLVNTKEFKKGLTVIYCYPLTGRPDQELPKGWNEIPGARGCTPQALTFKESYDDFKKKNIKLFGLSTQTTEYQKEMVERLGLPFPILSDSDFKLTKLLNLPTLEVEGKILLKRLTIVIQDGIIIKVFYPVFPPNINAEEVLNWLSLITNRKFINNK